MSAEQNRTVPFTDIPIERVRCHAIGHEWDETEAQRKPKFGFLLTLRCTSCTTIREDLTDLRGEVMHRRYIHTEAYKSDPKLTRIEWRGMFARWLVKVQKELKAQQEAQA